MPNGDQATVVPGQTLGTTPPTFPQQGGAGQVDEQTKNMLMQLLRIASQRRFAGQPRPTPVPGLTDPNEARSIGMNTAWPSAWGFERFAAGLQTQIANAVKMHKESQIQKAEAVYDYYGNLMNNFLSAQSTGDPKQIQEAQKKLDDFTRDKGNMTALHKAAKALNQSWLDPEKTDAYGTAMQRTIAKQKQKEQARGGMQNIFRSVLRKAFGQRPQAEMTPEESVAAGRQIQEKAPTTPGGGLDINAMRSVADLEKVISEVRQKYQYVPAQDGSGTVWAVNKNDPKDAHIVRDAESGEAIKGGKTPAKEGQVYSLNGVPIGVFHKGKPVLPGDADWSEQDAKLFGSAVGGMQEKQMLRLDPIISAQVGAPPSPKDFKGGRSSEGYGKALATWGKQAEAIKNQMAMASGTARAKAYNEYHSLQVMDDDGNVYYTTAKAAIEGGLAGSGEGVKLKPREVQIKDIEVASKKTREAINALDDAKFSPTQVAKLYTALTTPDDTVAKAELTALATEDLTEKQQDFVVWIKQLNERAMSLRNVAGIGPGAQDLRDAIRGMIPGVRSGSKQMMNKQLDAFDNQVRILKGGIPHPGKVGKGVTPPKGAKILKFNPDTGKLE